MRDYDAVVIGGGINGLTTAAYLAKAGMSVGVFEARGQCGAHCDTVELGIPGFLHNTHAVWLVPAMSPCMDDLELESIEFVALAEELTERYGEQVDFVGWLADLELDALVTMTVGQLVEFVAGCLDAPDGSSDGSAEA